MVAQDISWLTVQAPKVYIVPVKVTRPTEAVQTVPWKCRYELSKICITVEDIGKRAASGFVGFQESDVVVRLAPVKSMLKCKK